MQKSMDIYNKYVKELFLLLLFQSTAAGLFFVSLAAKLFSSYRTVPARFLEDIFGLEGYSNIITFSLFFEIFLKSAALCVVQFMVLGFLFYIFINALQKNNILFFSILFALRKTLLITGFFLLISIPFIKISMPIAITFLIGAFFLSVLVSYKSIKEIPGVDSVSGGYISLASYTAYIAFFFICILESIK